jgi:hypothetical protein
MMSKGLQMKLSILIPITLALMSAGCVNGKINPVVPQIVSALDTAGCELITVYVSNVEAGDVCDTATAFFNGILSSLSAPASVLPRKATVEKPHKYPVKYQGKTVGHFYKPYNAMVQGKLDDLQADAGVVVADGGAR